MEMEMEMEMAMGSRTACLNPKDSWHTIMHSLCLWLQLLHVGAATARSIDQMLGATNWVSPLSDQDG